MASSIDFKCLRCGSTELCFGYQGTSANVFVPSGTFTLVGYKMRSYVCLNCGQVGEYLSKEALLKLKERYKSKYS